MNKLIWDNQLILAYTLIIYSLQQFADLDNSLALTVTKHTIVLSEKVYHLELHNQ